MKKEDKTFVAITQRVDVTNERRDCLDQRWYAFLSQCGLTAINLPNNVDAAQALVNNVPVAGLVLSGGNDLVKFSGDAPERDATEMALVERFINEKKPIIGVCRGMQLLADYYGSTLTRVSHHTGIRHTVRLDSGTAREVNSYHHYGILELGEGLRPGAMAEDHSIEAMYHDNGRISAVMWHPEREAVPHADDVRLFRRIFIPA